MNPTLRLTITIVAGIALGLFVTWWTVIRGSMPDGVTNGPWKTNLSAGSTQGDPYTRARVAVHGLFALNKNETIYFTATDDDAGTPLDGRCEYAVAGHDPDARWWSITAYGADDFLIPNPAKRYSVSKETVVRAADGSFTVQVGGAAKPANWIALAPGRISLTLRLYNPGPAAALDPGSTPLPTLTKVSCP